MFDLLKVCHEVTGVGEVLWAVRWLWVVSGVQTNFVKTAKVADYTADRGVTVENILSV